MNISLRKSLAGAALVAAVTLAGAGVASAEVAGPVTVTVPPGGRACVTTTQRAGYKVRADGSAPNAVGSLVQWTMANSFDGANFQQIASQTLSGNYYGGELTSSFYPQYFPSYWKFCARNLGTTTNVKATLTLKTDGNAF
jgi:hypothetical protein